MSLALILVCNNLQQILYTLNSKTLQTFDSQDYIKSTSYNLSFKGANAEFHEQKNDNLYRRVKNK